MTKLLFFLITAVVALSLRLPAADGSAIVSQITDPEIRAGVEAAINQNLLPAATQQYYPGFYEITADGGFFGGGASWPGLDSWQMSGAYLLLGRTQLVLDYFEFVRASQRQDGAIPFAIFPGNTPAERHLGGLRYPQDLFTYQPPKRAGVPASAEETRSWIGLFVHWQPKANPLSRLGTICYILTAGEIYEHTQAGPWLQERIASIEAAAKEVLSHRSGNGLISGSGFYTELPPRYGWDGITQCYAIHAFRQMAKLCDAAGDRPGAAAWAAHAAALTRAFTAAFWRNDHYAEYVHAERGVVDRHGLSDVNWAAVAFGIADDEKLKMLWPRLLNEPEFHYGNMPTMTVTKPFSYEQWEYSEPLSFEMTMAPLNDVAAMGRVWHLEAKACQRMQATERLVETARLVCRAAAGGYWRERYHPQPDGTVVPAGAQKYCEYAAVLTRVVLGNPAVFCR
ncbi:MAG: hypothetical protein PHE83_09700 [Opitutaceae bacterium]|nr:hypothetical protein [Opitutaceae bacterium]